MDGRGRRRGAWLRDAAAIIGGNLLLGFLVVAFALPHDIIMGGATGIGIVLSRLLPLPMATIVLLFNLAMLLLGALVLGHKFFLATVVSSLLYPLTLAVFERIPNISALTHDRLLAVIFGGALLGVALGLVMRVGASTGGTDVLNLIMHRTWRWPLSVCVWTVDIVIIGAQALFSSPQAVLYGILMLVIESLVLERVTLLGRAQIQLFAISPAHESIRQALLRELEAGVTMLLAQTGHSRTEQPGVLCVIPARKLHAAVAAVQSIDPNAFITITRIKEVHGRGFTLARHHLPPCDRTPPVPTKK